ncbi:hypothetical protein VTK73DRAFT_10191 [Phialemonium thermophilum]|uniref:ML-like domain-containing protein n=1 Tax=Phialemonium thermophilum TaxID=223376 RepID=A0ABR3XI05_9PEZI
MVPFENCLSDSYRFNNPTLLQWVPLYVNASFNKSGKDRRRLEVTMWGNVTGSLFTGALPPPDSPDWSDPSKTNGKILDEPEPDSPHPKLTTLHSKVNFLSYEPWSENTNFCNTSLTNATCPLGPVFNTTDVTDIFNLPSVTMSHDFFSSYSFTSLSATFVIIYGDSKGTNIGCASAVATPDLGSIKWTLKFLPLLVLLFVGGATVFAGIFSPWGTADIFHWTSNYGRDADLLRLVTPGFGDCLQYIQFATLTGGLTLNYPGFYQPAVSQASWSSLMFNESLVSKADPWQSVVDGIYVTHGRYGLERLAQLVGMAEVEDIWAGMAVWLLVIIAGVFVLIQCGFLVQWIYRAFKNIPEEDLRAKNIPFSLGNVVRIVLNYFLLPIVALSTFQLVVASHSPAYTVALAVLTLVLIIGFAAWLLYLIGTTKPRAFLYDDLPTLLLYGPLYNTYSDEAAAFALIPVVLTFLRGIAIGAVQPSGVAQLVLLAICEVIQILTLHAFRPFHSPTSMNAYHTLFSVARFVTVVLMIAFVPSLGVTEGTKGWIGYAILVIHAALLIFGFLLNALQTIVEVAARMMGAGGDDVRGQTRGGLSKIFGMRQLARRMSRREVGPSRQSQLSTSAMLDTEEASKGGYIMSSGRLRSESAGSMGVFTHHRHTSSSIMDNMSMEGPARNFDGASSFTPNTPGEASTFSFLPSPGGPGRAGPPSGPPLLPTDPYYRPPRPRRTTLDNRSSSVDKERGSWASGDAPARGLGLLGGPVAAAGEGGDAEGQIERASTPAPYAAPAINLAPRTDYSTREVDFYYGVRGERLNSDAPTRKLGTGPADPTGPMASAAGWLRGMLGGKRKEKGKGFEVVRSARMPPAMRVGGGEFGDDGAPQGIPVAMGVLRNGPIESDDEDEGKHKKNARRGKERDQPAREELLDVDGSPRQDESDGEEPPSGLSDEPPRLPELSSIGSIRIPSRIQSKASRRTAATADDGSDEDVPPVPSIPRKSSRRDSAGAFRRSGHSSFTMVPPPGVSAEAGDAAAAKRASTLATEDMSDVDLRDPQGPPTGYGSISQGDAGRVGLDTDLLGTPGGTIDKRKP